MQAWADLVTVVPTGRTTVMHALDAVANAAIAGLGLTVSSAENVLGALRTGALLQVLGEYEIVGSGATYNEIIIQYPSKKLLPGRIRVLVDYLVGELRGRDPTSLVAGSSL